MCRKTGKYMLNLVLKKIFRIDCVIRSEKSGFERTLGIFNLKISLQPHWEPRLGHNFIFNMVRRTSPKPRAENRESWAIIFWSVTKLAAPRNGSWAAVDTGQREENEPSVYMAVQGSGSVLDVSSEASCEVLTHPNAELVDAGGALWGPNRRADWWNWSQLLGIFEKTSGWSRKL